MVDGTSITDAALGRKLEGSVQRNPALKVRISHVAKRQARVDAIRELAKRAGVATIEIIASIDTQVPDTQPAPPSDVAPTVVLSIDGKGRLLLDARVVPDRELDAELAKLGKQTKAIALRPDPATPYGTIAKLVERCKAAGLTDVTFIAN